MFWGRIFRFFKCFWTIFLGGEFWVDFFGWRILGRLFWGRIFGSIFLVTNFGLTFLRTNFCFFKDFGDEIFGFLRVFGTTNLVSGFLTNFGNEIFGFGSDCVVHKFVPTSKIPSPPKRRFKNSSSKKSTQNSSKNL